MSSADATGYEHAFLAGGGEMGARIRGFGWAATSLGAPGTWTQSLRLALSICLNSAFPTAIYWGPELRLFYNDAWSPILAERHPGSLGQPAALIWHDIWDIVGPQFEQVLSAGEGLSTFDQQLPLERDGRITETYWNYSLTPIRGEDGVLSDGCELVSVSAGRPFVRLQGATATRPERRPGSPCRSCGWRGSDRC